MKSMLCNAAHDESGNPGVRGHVMMILAIARQPRGILYSVRKKDFYGEKVVEGRVGDGYSASRLRTYLI